MTLSEFYAKVESNLRHTTQRYGQLLFNTLYEVRPELADKIRATDLDPFYVKDEDPLNPVWDKLYQFLQENW
jgi:hypothetical protein